MKTQMLPATSKLNYGNTWIKLNKNYLQSLFTDKICEEQNERYVQNSLFSLYTNKKKKKKLIKIELE